MKTYNILAALTLTLLIVLYVLLLSPLAEIAAWAAYGYFYSLIETIYLTLRFNYLPSFTLKLLAFRLLAYLLYYMVNTLTAPGSITFKMMTEKVSLLLYKLTELFNKKFVRFCIIIILYFSFMYVIGMYTVHCAPDPSVNVDVTYTKGKITGTATATDVLSNVGITSLALTRGTKVAATVATPIRKVRTFAGVAGISIGLHRVRTYIGQSPNTGNVSEPIAESIVKSIVRPSSPNNPFLAPSILEPEESYAKLLLKLLPDSVKLDVLARIPNNPVYPEGEINLLIMKINLDIYLLTVRAIGIIFFGTLVMILKAINNDQVKYYLPNKLANFASSKRVKTRILINEVGVIYLFMFIIEVISYLYSHSIPVELGDICDAYIRSKKGGC